MKRTGNLGEPLQATAGKRPLVLYVEDDPASQLVTESKLRRKYDLVLASTASKACSILCSQGKELSIILLDIELQGSEINGFQIAQIVRGKLDRKGLPWYVQEVPVLEVPIIFVTAYGSKYDSQMLESCSASVIDKPVDFVELETCMTRIKLEHFRKIR